MLQLKERDACGNTPLMTAIQCHNFKAAIYILDFVERNKGTLSSCALSKQYTELIGLHIHMVSKSDFFLNCLPFVDNTCPKLQCSMKDMIYPEAFNGMTPLHALTIACTENLPPSGLGNSLTVTNLPSSYTPRILLKLFQGRYPSAYRATIPPAAMEGRKVSVVIFLLVLQSNLH